MLKKNGNCEFRRARLANKSPNLTGQCQPGQCADKAARNEIEGRPIDHADENGAA